MILTNITTSRIRLFFYQNAKFKVVRNSTVVIKASEFVRSMTALCWNTE